MVVSTRKSIKRQVNVDRVLTTVLPFAILVPCSRLTSASLLGHVLQVCGYVRGQQQLLIMHAKGRQYNATARTDYKIAHPAAEKKLLSLVKERIGKARFVSSRWLSLKMRHLVKELEGQSEFVADRYWRKRFRERHDLVLRRPSNGKSKSVKERLDDMVHWHQSFRVMLADNEEGTATQWCETYGRYPLQYRWNADQVPLPFVIDMGLTAAFRGTNRVHVKCPNPALRKRQATLQVLLRADGKQGRLAIIFRGAGQISALEKAVYASMDIDVLFQPKAWCDAATTLKWFNHTFAAAIAGSPGEHLLLLDNLAGQDVRPKAGAIGKRFKAAASKMRTRIWNFLAGATDEFQQVDAGVGAFLKYKIGVITDTWLDQGNNLEMWESHNLLPAWRRRVLMATWAQQAWEAVCDRDGYIRKLWEKTGGAITITGEGYDRIRLEGVEEADMVRYRSQLLHAPTPWPAASLLEQLQHNFDKKELRALCTNWPVHRGGPLKLSTKNPLTGKSDNNVPQLCASLVAAGWNGEGLSLPSVIPETDCIVTDCIVTDANLSATNTIVSDTHLGTPGAANVLALIAKNGDITPTGDDGNPFKESANEAGATQVSILYDDEDDQCCDDDVADEWDQDDDPNEFAEADQDWWNQQQ